MKPYPANLIVAWIVPALFMAACKNAEKQEVKKEEIGLTKVEMAAKFPYDLGQGTVDVSNYPENIRQDYRVFLAVCSVCHTTARPLNSPYTSRSDWKRFVHRMHIKMENRGISLDLTDEKRIVDFLTYDARVRKIGRKKEFESQQRTLDMIYPQVVQERNRLILEETRRLPKKETPYVGVK